MKDYIKKIRSKIGNDHFIHPAARILIENNTGEFLFIKKVGNGSIGIPAGSLEEGETIGECIIREVKEETGIEIIDPILIGISSSPDTETVAYPNGDIIQYFTIEFYCNSYNGILQVNDTSEVDQVAFLNSSYLQFLPPGERSIISSLEYYLKTGKVKVK